MNGPNRLRGEGSRTGAAEHALALEADWCRNAYGARQSVDLHEVTRSLENPMQTITSMPCTGDGAGLALRTSRTGLATYRAKWQRIHAATTRDYYRTARARPRTRDDSRAAMCGGAAIGLIAVSLALDQSGTPAEQNESHSRSTHTRAAVPRFRAKEASRNKHLRKMHDPLRFFSNISWSIPQTDRTCTSDREFSIADLDMYRNHFAQRNSFIPDCMMNTPRISGGSISDGV